MKLSERIESVNSIAIAGHTRPDGDCVGSCMGLYNYLKENYDGKIIGIVAHRAPQLALEVITKNISWEEANQNDWRKTGDWQPGWEYTVEE